MKFLITGVAGFIGSHLAEHLCNEGHTVIGVDNLICGNITNLKWVKPNHMFQFIEKSAHDQGIISKIDTQTIVIHLGAISSLAANQSEPATSYQNNVVSTAGLLEGCRRQGAAHFIFASTSAIYENSTTYPSAEDDIVSPDLVYSLGKKHCEDLVHSFNSIYGLQYTIIRFFNVYGANQDANRSIPPLIPYIIDCFKKGEQPLLHSDGKQKRDYIYVKDLIDLIMRIIEKPQNTVMNAASGTLISVEEIVDIIKAEMQVNIEPIYREPKLFWEKATDLWNGVYKFPAERMTEEVNKFTLGSGEKARRLLGWSASTTMEMGIRKIIQRS